MMELQSNDLSLDGDQHPRGEWLLPDSGLEKVGILSSRVYIAIMMVEIPIAQVKANLLSPTPARMQFKEIEV